jgi:hypothetical protein
LQGCCSHITWFVLDRLIRDQGPEADRIPSRWSKSSGQDYKMRRGIRVPNLDHPTRIQWPRTLHLFPHWLRERRQHPCPATAQIAPMSNSQRQRRSRSQFSAWLFRGRFLLRSGEAPARLWWWRDRVFRRGSHRCWHPVWTGRDANSLKIPWWRSPTEVQSDGSGGAAPRPLYTGVGSYPAESGDHTVDLAASRRAMHGVSSRGRVGLFTWVHTQATAESTRRKQKGSGAGAGAVGNLARIPRAPFGEVCLLGGRWTWRLGPTGSTASAHRLRLK